MQDSSTNEQEREREAVLIHCGILVDVPVSNQHHDDSDDGNVKAATFHNGKEAKPCPPSYTINNKQAKHSCPPSRTNSKETKPSYLLSSGVGAGDGTDQDLELRVSVMQHCGFLGDSEEFTTGDRSRSAKEKKAKGTLVAKGGAMISMKGVTPQEVNKDDAIKQQLDQLGRVGLGVSATTLQKTDRVITTPGAFRFRGSQQDLNLDVDVDISNRLEQQLDYEHDDSEASFASPGQSTTNTTGTASEELVRSSNDLTVADLVFQEDEYDLEAAQHAKEHCEKSAMILAEKRQRHLVRLGMIGAGCLVLIVGILLVVCLVVIPNNSSDAVVESISIGSTTSSSNTHLPEIVTMEEHVLSLLPDDTVQDIQSANERYPQYLAYEWIMADPHRQNYSNRRIVQRFALAVVYHATGGPNYWSKNNDWLSYVHHECDWFGQSTPGLYGHPEQELDLFYNVSATSESISQPCGPREPQDDNTAHYNDPEEEGVFQHLWLLKNGLKGTLPRELYLLTSLKSISMDRNPALTGPLSSHIGDLQDLEALALFSNSMTGSIPSEIGLLSDHLTYIWIMSNQLEGSLPTELGQLSDKLQFLLLDTNELTGELPTELGQLSSLWWLWLWSNALTGTLPTELGNMESLMSVAIDTNQFEGTIPTEFGGLQNLWQLQIANLQLTGSIPTEIGLMTGMGSLTMFDNFLSGPLPSELGFLTHVWTLHLWNNALTGTIPTELGNMEALGSAAIDTNQFEGTIPTELAQLPNLWKLHISDLQLTGSMPTEIGLMTGMSAMVLSGNSFSGSLPSELGMLSQMWSFKISDANLSGALPSEFGMMEAIEVLEIHGNQITGQVPSELGELQILAWLQIQNNTLTGGIPQSLCNLTTWWKDGLSVDCDLVQCTCDVCVCD